MNNDPIIIISGATASGKTSLSIALAKELLKHQLTAEVINFDSLLFYKDLNIGTAKPTDQEKEGIAHHLIDICCIEEEMNASRFIELATPLIEDLHHQKKIPILVGGSAFYIRALIKGMYETPSISTEVRLSVEHTLKEKGYHYIRDELQKKDTQSYLQLHENDKYRNIRAYEFLLQTGFSISKEKEKINDPYDFSKNQHINWKIFHIYLDIPKEEHWSIIKARTHDMLELGLIKEVQDLLSRNNITGKEKSLMSIGYKETIEYIKNNKKDKTIDLLEKIYISTRQLSKSQKTFFKKIKPKHIYHPLQDKEKILNEGLDFVKQFY